MKKALSILMSSLLAFSVVFSTAYVETPEKSEKNQLDLVAIKAVDVQNSVMGIRAYSDIVDTTRAYQVNDVIFLAATVSVKNIAKSDYKNLKSIKDKKIDLIIGSPNIDLSFSKSSSPVVISAIYNGYDDSNIGLIGVPGMRAEASNVINIASIAKYNKDKNEIKVTFKGRELNKTSAIEFSGIGASVNSDGTISIPALRADNGKGGFTIGNSTYKYDYDAPKEVQYSVVIMGVTKDNVDASKGNFYAKIQVKGAEEFVSFSSYYIDVDGNKVTDVSKLKEMKDYVKVSVDKLEIEGGYSVYRYSVPASGVVADIPIFYLGEANVTGSNVLAQVNPAKWDYNSGKTPKTIDSKVAGGVNSSKAINNVSNTEKNSPLTSLIYLDSKTYYAPYYYRGIELENVADTSGGSRTAVKEDLLKKSNFLVSTITSNSSVTNYDGYVAKFSDVATVSASDILAKTNVTITDKVTGKGVAPQRYEDALKAYKANLTELNIATEMKPVADALVAAYNAKYNANPTTQLGISTYFASAVSAKFPADFAAKLSNDSVFKALLTDYANGTRTINPANVKSGELPADLAAAAMNVLVDVSKDIQKTPADAPILFGSAPTAAAAVTAATVAYNDSAATTFDGAQGVYFVGLAGTVASKTGFLWTADQFNGATAGSAAANLTGGGVHANFGGAPGFSTIAAVNTAVAAIDGSKTNNDAAVLALNNFVAAVAGIKAFIASDATATPAQKQLGNGFVDTLVAEANLALAALTTGVPKLSATSATVKITPQPYWAYDNSYLPLAVKTSADALVTYYKNGTEISVVVNPNPKVSTQWDVLVDYGTTSKYASVSSTSAGTSTEQLTGFFSDPAVNLNLPADTTFDFLPWNDTTQTSIVEGTATANFREFDKVSKVYVERNADSTIKRIGFVFNNYKPGDVIPWAHDTVGSKAIEKAPKAVYAKYLTAGGAKEGTPIGAFDKVVDSNGIAVYTITEPTNDRPVISIATEKTYFKSDDGYGIALFENAHTFSSTNNNNSSSNVSLLKQDRVYRANATNFSNVTTGGYAATSADMYNAVRYFGLDASFGTTYKVVNADFEKKGAASAYSDEVKGEFKYGVITVIEDEVDEVVKESEVPAETEETEEPTETIDVSETDVPTPTNETTPVPQTGDVSANVAIALGLAALVSAAGFAFVVKKTKN